ncbi:hypothetical protein [Halosegnis longus]|uniref:Uncharacterized protein n=1 Tax=Halosegnis longus TaxID=2216012 RepID=A0AAJ4R8L7_9EURY|nr:MULTISPECIES: hypothetical protein [Halobacteriales]RNJ26309.1 hypothetical protein Nmn1133_06230 [Salella cibi]
MTLLDRVRRWLFGGDDAESSETESESASANAGEQRLDPDNVTQTRTTSDDDAVSQLQDVKREETDEERSDG